MDISSEELQNKLKDQSLSGESGKRNPNRKIKITYSDFKKCIISVAVASTIASTIVVGGGVALYNKLSNSIIDSSLFSEFRNECISKQTHRTQDNEHYYYDYDDIAFYIEKMDDFDLGVYLSYGTIGPHQTDQVLRYTNYRSFDNYLEAHNYEDAKDFAKDMHKQLALEHKISKEKDELAKMKAEHADMTNNEQDSYNGGSK